MRSWSWCAVVASATRAASSSSSPLPVPSRLAVGYLLLHGNRSRDGGLSCDEICAADELYCDPLAAQAAGRSQQELSRAFRDVGTACDAWFPLLRRNGGAVGGDHPIVYEDEYSGPIAVRNESRQASNESLRANGTSNNTAWTDCLLAGSTAPPPNCSAVYAQFLDDADQLCFCKEEQSWPPPSSPPPYGPTKAAADDRLGLIVGLSVGGSLVVLCLIGLAVGLCLIGRAPPRPPPPPPPPRTPVLAYEPVVRLAL